MDRSHSYRKCVVLVILLLGAVSGSIAPQESQAKWIEQDAWSPLVAPRFTIEQVLSGDWSLRAIEDSKDYEKAARDFVGFKKNRMPIKKKLTWIAECYRKPGLNPFCDLVVSPEGPPESREDPATQGIDEEIAQSTLDPQEVEGLSKAAILSSDEVRKLLTRADLEQLSAASERQFYRAMRGVQAWDELDLVSEKALKAEACPTHTLLTALAQKAEEYFPDTKHLDQAIQLYERALQCSKKMDETTQKAAFRYSLLQIWRKKWSSAETSLARLTEIGDGDYSTRALYWRAEVAEKLGKKTLAKNLRERLVRGYPLAYHALGLPSSYWSTNKKQFLSEKTSLVQVRSAVDPEINRYIRGVEALRAVRAGDLSYEMLEFVLSKSRSAEPELRLYLALLYGQLGNRIGQFRELARLLRDHPELITRSVLEQFYPLQRFEILKQYGSQVHPLFTAALIRQESGFNERARSPAGAMGLMQIMPATARTLGRVKKSELYHPNTNIRLGVKYFAQLLSRFDGDHELSLAAYNAGPERVDAWKRRYPTDNKQLFLDLIPFKETRDYVALIGRNYYWYSQIYGKQLPRKQVNRSVAMTLIP